MIKSFPLCICKDTVKWKKILTDWLFRSEPLSVTLLMNFSPGGIPVHFGPGTWLKTEITWKPSFCKGYGRCNNRQSWAASLQWRVNIKRGGRQQRAGLLSLKLIWASLVEKSRLRISRWKAYLWQSQCVLVLVGNTIEVALFLQPICFSHTICSDMWK